MVSLQYKTFLQQSCCCSAVYLPSLLFCFYKVNFDPAWAYDPNVVMNNLEFNVAAAAVVATGVVASLLAVSPNWMNCIESVNNFDAD